MGLVHTTYNLLMQLSGVYSSIVDIFKKTIFAIVTTKNDHTCYIKHVLCPFYVFFTLFGHRVPEGVSQGTSTHNLQPAQAIFRSLQLKN